MKILIILIILITACSRSADGYTSATQVDTSEEKNIPVEVLTVEKGRLIPYIQVSGIVSGIQEVWVISETSGIITDSNLKLGQYVTREDTLLSIENDLSKLNLELSYQQYMASKLDFEGNKKSFNSGNISRSQYNTSLVNLLSAESNYEISKKNFESTFIKSPISGFVAITERSLTPGNFISNGVRVARIIDYSSYVMEVSLGQGQVDLIAVGSEAEIVINIGYTDLMYTGVISEIGAGSDPSTGSFPVLIKWNIESNNSKLKSGMSATASIKTITETESIIVPDRAIIKRGVETYVFIAIEDSALIKQVSTGNSFGGKTVIKSGLKSGEKLIISSLNSINDGSGILGKTIGSTQDWK